MLAKQWARQTLRRVPGAQTTWRRLRRHAVALKAYVGNTSGGGRRASIDELVGVARIPTVQLELTTRCNLRCAYCRNKSDHSHYGSDLKLPPLDDLISQFKELGVTSVHISGAGETTVLDGWARYVQGFCEAGFQVDLQSNLSRPFGEEEIAALARLRDLITSSDTADPVLFKRIRGGSDMRSVLLNILRVRTCSVRSGHKPPRLCLSCVVSAQTAGGLDDLMAMAIAEGIGHVHFLSLTPPSRPGDNGFQVFPLQTLSPEKLAKARTAYQRAKSLAQGAQIGFSAEENVERTLGDAPREPSKPAATAAAPSRPSRGCRMTKRCLKPWERVIWWATNAVSACCAYCNVCGLRNGDLVGAVTGPEWQRLRRGLLTGDLPERCTSCPTYPDCTVEELQCEVTKLVDSAAPRPNGDS